MTEENPFFTFGETEEKKKISPKVKPIEKPKEQFTGKMPEKIIVSRIVDKDGNVSIAWADKDTIHPEALKYYDKYKEFY